MTELSSTPYARSVKCHTHVVAYYDSNLSYLLIYSYTKVISFQIKWVSILRYTDSSTKLSFLIVIV